MQVSFVIPLYNCLAFTRACLESLQATLPRDLSHEIILVDDGSTDGTREWLATLDSPVRVILNERNLGYATANNRAAATARGEWLVLLNNDLVLTPRWLEPMLALHRRLGAKAGIVGNVQRSVRTGALDHTSISINAKGKPIHDTDHAPWMAGKKVIAVTGACMLLHRSLWQNLGGFNERFKNGAEDVDLCLRAAGLHLLNAVASRSVVLHHISPSPGRKLRDEENSFLLARLWHDRLARLAEPRVNEVYLEDHWGGASEPPPLRDGLGALACWLRLGSAPPAFIRQAAISAIDAEIARWEKILPTERMAER